MHESHYTGKRKETTTNHSLYTFNPVSNNNRPVRKSQIVEGSMQTSFGGGDQSRLRYGSSGDEAEEGGLGHLIDVRPKQLHTMSSREKQRLAQQAG
jgi:hypothetical protein